MKVAQIAKQETIDQVKVKIAESKATLLVDYRGLTVAQVTDLRRKLRGVGGEMGVVKNTLIARAAGKEELAAILNGPTAIVYSADEVSSAKVLAIFAKAAGLPKFKGGLMDDRVLTVAEVETLSTIPSKEVLQAKLVGMLASQPTRLVWALNGNLTKFVRVLAEVASRKAVN